MAAALVKNEKSVLIDVADFLFQSGQQNIVKTGFARAGDFQFYAVAVVCRIGSLEK